MHVACTNLDYVNIFYEAFNFISAHNFGYNGKTGFFTSCFQIIKTKFFQALEAVRGSSRFEGAATKQACATKFYRFSNGDYLFFTFYRTRSCHYLNLTTANGYTCYINDTVFRMESTVSAFERFGYAQHFFNAIINAKLVDVQRTGITNNTENSITNTGNFINHITLSFKFLFNTCFNVLGCIRFEYDYHKISLSFVL